MRWDQRSRLGAVAVCGVSVAALLFLLVPTQIARIGLVLMAPVVVWMSYPDSRAGTTCGGCGARKALKPQLGRSTVAAASRAQVVDGHAEVVQGWDVTTPVETGCAACGRRRRSDLVEFVARADAPTAAEALVRGRASSQR